MNVIRKTFCFALFSSAFSLFGQTFTEVSIGSPAPFYEGKIISFDYDNDLDNDLILIGNLSVHLYKNGGGSFLEVFGHNLPELLNPGYSFGDFNNDGYADLVLTGNTMGNPQPIPITKVYLNSNGDGSFAEMPNTNLIGLLFGSVDCADFDADGDVDILMAGYSKDNITKSVVYSNNGNGTFSEISLNLPSVHGSVLWGDYDSDGDLDILISGEIYVGINNNLPFVTKIFRNDSNYTFTEAVPSLSQIKGKASWADVNQDGLLDVLVTGFQGFIEASELYVNGGNSTFTKAPSIPFSGSQLNEFVWIDVDNDGDKDLVTINLTSQVKIFLNSNSTFAELAGTNFPNSQIIGTNDFDSDGDLDLILIGFDLQTSSPKTTTFRNDITTTNSNPSPPTGLNVELLDNLTTRLSWSTATDTESNASGLTYNIRIGTTSGGIDIKSPLSSTTGALRLPHYNIYSTAESIKINNLSDGTYYASVQTIDQSNRASSFSSEVMFTLAGRPTIPLAPTNLTLANLNTGSVKIKYSDLSFNEDNFVIERSTNDETNYVTLSSPGSNVTSYEDATVGYSTKYYYRVKSVNADGSSAYSASATITTHQKGIFQKLTYLNLPGNEFNGGFSCAWVDIDNDNDLDPVIIGSLGTNKVYTTNNDGTFTRVLTGPLVTEALQSRTGTWGDYDNDGDDDLFVATSSTSKLYRNDGGGNFMDVTASPFTENNTHDSNGAAWGDYDNDGFIDLIVVNYMAPPYLFHNNGNGTFTKITSGQLGNEVGSYSVPSWCDIDNNGFLDLILLGNFGETAVFKNTGGVLIKINAGALSSVSVNGSAASWADYDGDGDFDLFVPNYTNQSDAFFTNRGDGKFDLITNALTSGPIGTDDAAWGDYDNDGKIDLLKSANNGKHLFKNKGNGVFEEIINEFSLDGIPYGAVSWGDYNNDGFLDLLGVQFYNENLLLKNNGNSNHWLIVNLEGTATNRSAIGVQAKVKTGDVWQYDFVQSQTGGRSQNSLPLEFGLGTSTKADSIIVSWPKRGYQTLSNVNSDQILTITEPNFPVSPTLVSVTSNGLSSTITWTDNSDNETGFIIEKSLVDRFHFTKVTTLPTNTISYEDVSQIDGDSIFFRVYAVNGSDFSFESNVKGVLLPLNKPTNLVGTLLDAGVKVEWTDNSKSETSYEIERAVDAPTPSFLLQHTALPNEVSFTDVDASEATHYLYRIRTVKNSIKSSYSDTLKISTPLKKPTNLQVVWNGITSNFTWTDNSQKELKYIIERSPADNLHFLSIGEANANATTFAFSDQPDQSTVFYRVKAASNGFESAYSNEISVILTETKDNAFGQVSIFPNPAEDFVYIKNLRSDTHIVSLINSTGVIEESREVNCCDQLSIPVSHLSRGLYIIKIDNQEGKSTYSRLLKLGR